MQFRLSGGFLTDVCSLWRQARSGRSGCFLLTDEQQTLAGPHDRLRMSLTSAYPWAI